MDSGNPEWKKLRGDGSEQMRLGDFYFFSSKKRTINQKLMKKGEKAKNELKKLDNLVPPSRSWTVFGCQPALRSH